MLKNIEKFPKSRCRCEWLPEFNQLFIIHRYISSEFFINIWSV